MAANPSVKWVVCMILAIIALRSAYDIRVVTLCDSVCATVAWSLHKERISKVIRTIKSELFSQSPVEFRIEYGINYESLNCLLYTQLYFR